MEVFCNDCYLMVAFVVVLLFNSKVEQCLFVAHKHSRENRVNDKKMIEIKIPNFANEKILYFWSAIQPK